MVSAARRPSRPVPHQARLADLHGARTSRRSRRRRDARSRQCYRHDAPAELHPISRLRSQRHFAGHDDGPTGHGDYGARGDARRVSFTHACDPFGHARLAIPERDCGIYLSVPLGNYPGLLIYCPGAAAMKPSIDIQSSRRYASPSRHGAGAIECVGRLGAGPAERFRRRPMPRK